MVHDATIRWSNAGTLGFERIGSSLSMAVDPNNSATAYVAWADRVGTGDIQTIHENLVRAQDIIAELRAALDFDATPVSQDIDRVYEYLGHLLMQANINKESDSIDEFVEHATALRDTWDEAFRRAESENPAGPPVPDAGSQGASIVNLQG